MLRWIFLLVAFAALASSASACSVPVFRYALEHWQPDPFMVAVFHRGELTERQQSLLKELDLQGPDGVRTGNVMAKAIDVDNETDSRLQELWKLQDTATLPWMAVHAPTQGGPPQRIWAGDFNEENVSRLTQSPARKEISERLLAGDSVVWVFLESGDPEKDEPAYKLVTDGLSQLQKELKLPEIEAADLGELSTLPEVLRLAFSTVRVSRADPEEAQFVNMLLHVEPDLRNDEYAGEPMVFPMFGRGRVLYSLVGEGITPSTIEEAARFLVGECQCVVKIQNPGVDSLMSVAWERYFKPTPEVEDTRPLLVDMGRFSNGPATSPQPVADGPQSEPSGELLAIDAAALEGSAVASSEEKLDSGSAAAKTEAVARGSGEKLWAFILLVFGATVVLFAFLPRSK